MKWFALIGIYLALTACSAPQFHPVSTLKVDASIEPEAFLLADGYRLPYSRSWPDSPPKALVIALHGFNDYRKAYDGMCSYLSTQRVACIAYDQRGFGETDFKGFWPQDSQHEKDLKTIVSLLHQKYPTLPLYVAGESMGGAVILSALSHTPEYWARHLNGAILFAPAVWARSTQPWYQRFGLWMAVHTAPGWKPTGESLDIVATDNREALREMYYDENVIKETRIDAIYGLTNLMDRALASSDKLSLNTLILYGEKDQVIPKEPTCEMLERTELLHNPPSVVLYPDGYHMLTRDLQAENAFADVLRWIEAGRAVSISTSKDKLSTFCSS